MKRYRILESAEHRVESVHGYDDLEIHHPRYHGHQPKRHYADVDGRREEVLKTRTSSGHLMVSKDFILTDETGSAHVRVPSPVAGYIGAVDPANGLVRIYDRQGGELIAQIRHMDLAGSGVHVGQTVAYGEPLGYQGGYNKGKPHAFGTHMHVDFNTSRLDQFKQYLTDLDRGVITIDGVPATKSRGEHAASHQRSNTAHASNAPRVGGADVRSAQAALAHLGYTGADGRLIEADGIVGRNSRHAVEQFQRDHGLPVTGGLDATTRQRLAIAERSMASRTHPANDLYRQSLSAVQALDRQMGIPSGPHTIALAGVAAAEAARAGLTRIDRIEMTSDRTHVQAVQFTGGADRWVTNLTSGAIDVAHAVKQPLEASSRLAEEAIGQRQRLEHQIAHERAPMRSPVL